MSNIRRAIEEAIGHRRKERARLDGEIALLEETLHRLAFLGQAAPGSVLPTQFRGMPVGLAIRAYLDTKQGTPATFSELLEVLPAGGCPLKKYPKRTIALAVVNSPTFLEKRADDHIYLRNQKEA